MDIKGKMTPALRALSVVVLGLVAGCAPAKGFDYGDLSGHIAPLPTVKPAVERYIPSRDGLFNGVPAQGKAILVNIPSFELIAFEDGLPVMRSRVIVGKPRTQTPVMETETSVVRFRPTWTPTPRMIASGKYTPGTRPPGPRNPLGFLAIRLEPGMLIYLHGTNKPQLYDREMRALSHGCVRVERWDEVAAWVLDMAVEDVQSRAHGRRTFDMATSGIPVIMSYETWFPDENGFMREWPDVYGRGVMASGPVRQGTY